MIKPIKGYETRYWAHSSGRIISLINHNGKKIVVMKGSKVGRYAHVGMHNINGIRKNKNIHRMIAETFIPNPDNKPHVNHIDGNRFNNHVSNLEWNTASENRYHAFRLGLAKPLAGVNHNMVKLTEQDVLSIRDDPRGSYELGKIYNVASSTIRKIKLRNRWKHI